MGLHARVDGVGAHDVHSGDGVALILGGVEEVHEGLAGDNTGLDRRGKLGESLLGGSLGFGHEDRGPRSELGGGREGSGGTGEEGGDTELHFVFV